MRLVAVFLAVSLILALPARARYGDGVEQTIYRYGQPAASTGQPGGLTSTNTFYKDQLKIVCGYVDKKVEMISYTRTDRAFIPPEVEALLRTNSHRKKAGWTPTVGFTNGTYHRGDGLTATVKNTEVEIHSAKWVQALAKDEAAAKAADAKAAAETAATAAANAPSNYTPALDTNAAAQVESPAPTSPSETAPKPADTTP